MQCFPPGIFKILWITALTESMGSGPRLAGGKGWANSALGTQGWKGSPKAAVLAVSLPRLHEHHLSHSAHTFPVGRILCHALGVEEGLFIWSRRGHPTATFPAPGIKEQMRGQNHQLRETMGRGGLLTPGYHTGWIYSWSCQRLHQSFPENQTRPEECRDRKSGKWCWQLRWRL